MKLLIVTQAVDKNDPVLGFFHRWIEEFAKNFESVLVVCLKEGGHMFPHNVRVFSLGKEKRGEVKFVYAWRFMKLILQYRNEYDSVFVHMNQEYVLLGGFFWKLFRKKIYMWRNHYAGSFITTLAVTICTNIFCTSKSSYTAKFKKNILMPVGVDIATFRPVGKRNERSILSLGRIAPSKNIHIVLQSLKLLRDLGQSFSASVYGGALPKDAPYLNEQKKFVKENGMSEFVHFFDGVPNNETPEIYSAHTIFINASRSGMFDKTIFEAAACGCVVVASSADYEEGAPGLSFKAGDSWSLANKLEELLLHPKQAQERASIFSRVINENSLEKLVRILREKMA